MEDNRKNSSEEKKNGLKFNAKVLKRDNIKWIIFVTIISFVLSFLLSLSSSAILDKKNTGLYTGIFIVLIIILISIIFDIIGTAVTAADETPFHAMASRKLFGARQAMRLIRSADKVSNFCNDIVGDICGVVSGATSTYIIVSILAESYNIYSVYLGISITGMVASLTVGGKALGKTLAIKNSNYIIYKVAVVLTFTIGRKRLFKAKRAKKINKGREKDK